MKPSANEVHLWVVKQLTLNNFLNKIKISYYLTRYLNENKISINNENKKKKIILKYILNKFSTFCNHNR